MTGRGRCGPAARAPYRGGVYRFLLTPRWWGINVFALLAIPLCLFMGSWQLSRFEDRVNTHQQQEDRSARAKTEAARPLAGLLPVDTVTSGRQASARGHYDTGHQLLVPDRTLKDKHGRQQGFYVLDLLRTDGGKALPVVRGWLPGDAGSKADTAKVPAPPKGEVTVTGALQASENQGTDGVQAGGGLPQGQLGMISAASLVNIVPYEVYDAWITLTDTQAPLRAVPRLPPRAAAWTSRPSRTSATPASGSSSPALSSSCGSGSSAATPKPPRTRRWGSWRRRSRRRRGARLRARSGAPARVRRPRLSGPEASRRAPATATMLHLVRGRITAVAAIGSACHGRPYGRQEHPPAWS